MTDTLLASPPSSSSMFPGGHVPGGRVTDFPEILSKTGVRVGNNSKMGGERK